MKVTTMLFKPWNTESRKFEMINGVILKRIVGSVGDEEMRFIATDGTEYVLYYEHD